MNQCKESKKDNALLLVALGGATSGTGGGSGISGTETSENGTSGSESEEPGTSESGAGEENSEGGTPETVATPTFSPAAGNQTSNGTIAISTTTSGATIYYTTDGTTPTTSSTQYSSPLVNIWLLAGKTIKAIAVKSGFTDSEVLSGVFSLPPLKTGQTTVYVTGDDGTNQSGVARSYTDNGDGTVTDNATGLIWQKCSKGKNNDATCSGIAHSETWTNAVTYCNGLTLAGKTWRLPSREELETLLDHSQHSPAINTTAFPGTVVSYYWTSTTHAFYPTYAWVVIFNDSYLHYFDKSNAYWIRCVSGPQRQAVSNQFIDNGDGTVKDKVTGLIWQKCTRGQNNDSTCSGTATYADWSTAISYCSGLTLAGRTWRLPTVNELKTLQDLTKSTPPIIDTTAFPSTVAGTAIYASSTTYAYNPANAMVVNFQLGYVAHYSKLTAGFHVRCVSGP